MTLWCLIGHLIICNKRETASGYLCNCLEGYQGNPYMDLRCLGILIYTLIYIYNCPLIYIFSHYLFFYFTNIKECDKDHPNLNQCEHPKTFVNIPGNHTCSCPMWYHGHGRRNGERCTLNHLQIIRATIG